MTLKFYVTSLPYFQGRRIERMRFHEHADFTPNREEADIVVHKVTSKGELIALNKWFSSEAIKQTHFILFRLNLDRTKKLLELPIFNLERVFFYTYDLRDHVLTDDNIAPLKGFTIPPPFKFNLALPPNRTNKYHFSFKGNCKKMGWFGSCRIREHMKQICASSETTYPFLYEDTSDEHINNNKHRYYDILRTSKFGLVLHGDGRWSFRLIEVMGSGAIPVLVSDGLTLPFEEKIDYTNAFVILKEAQVYACKSVQEFVNLLPNENAEVYENKAKQIYDKYFSNDTIIMENVVEHMQAHSKPFHLNHQ